MNRKGISVASPMFLILGIFVMITGVVLAPPLKDVMDDQRTDLGCTWGNLTLGQSGTCIIVDITVPYFLAIVIIGVGLGLVAKGIK